MVGRMSPAKRELLSVEEARSQVGRLRRSVKRLQSRCGTVVSSWEPYIAEQQKGPDTLLSVLADQKDLLAAEERRLQELEKKLEQWIDLLPMPRWRMVLRFHYLDGMELGEIAQELSRYTGREFTMNQIYRFHRQALDAADRLWPLS